MTLLNAYYHNLHHVDLVNKGYTLELDDVTLGYIKVKTLDGQSNTYNAKLYYFISKDFYNSILLPNIKLIPSNLI
jgi:hypothetical protein